MINFLIYFDPEKSIVEKTNMKMVPEIKLLMQKLKLII